MSFLDKLTDVVKAVGNKLHGENAAPSAVLPKAEEPAPKDPLLESASIPPKPDIKPEYSIDDKYYSFGLSGDFVEFNSHCEMDPSFQYEPYSTELYTEYDGKLPIIAIGPNNDIFSAAISYEGGGRLPSGAKLCEKPSFLFSMQFEEHDRKIYAYAFAGGTARAHEMLCLEYDPALEGTELEKKLFSILDHVVETYMEWGR